MLLQVNIEATLAFKLQISTSEARLLDLGWSNSVVFTFKVECSSRWVMANLLREVAKLVCNQFISLSEQRVKRLREHSLQTRNESDSISSDVSHSQFRLRLLWSLLKQITVLTNDRYSLAHTRGIVEIERHGYFVKLFANVVLKDCPYRDLKVQVF